VPVLIVGGLKQDGSTVMASSNDLFVICPDQRQVRETGRSNSNDGRVTVCTWVCDIDGRIVACTKGDCVST
jgi:hypothetical protein